MIYDFQESPVGSGSGDWQQEWYIFKGSGIFVAGAGFAVRPKDKELNNIGSVATIWLRAEGAKLMGPCSGSGAGVLQLVTHNT